MKKITLLSAILVLFWTNTIFSQNTSVPACTFTSAADVANWAIWPTNVSKQFFNGNCVAMFVDNLYQNQAVYITSPVFNIPTSGIYELEIRYGLVYSTVAIVYELISSPAGTTIATTASSTVVGTCTNWPNAKITKLNYTSLPAGNYRFRAMLPMNSQYFIESLKSNINYSTMSVQDVSANHDFKIYPNPNNGSFIVKSKGDESVFNSLQIFSLQGKILFDQKITSSNQEIKTDGLLVGIYLIKMRSENGNFYYKKLVIQ